MYTDTDMLNHVYQSTQMGQEGILSVMKHVKEPGLNQALRQQLNEYGKICDTAYLMLKERGSTAEEISPMAKISSQMMTSMKTMADHTSSKVAEMMIQGNTMGMSKSIKYLNSYQNGDPSIRSLTEKLLATEENNIRQMKNFL